jgi:hypothetical protein
MIAEGGQQWEYARAQGKKRIAWILNEPITADIKVMPRKGKYYE